MFFIAAAMKFLFCSGLLWNNRYFELETKGESSMLDLYMVLLLAACYGIYSGFTAFCGRVIEETGGGSKW